MKGWLAAVKLQIYPKPHIVSAGHTQTPWVTPLIASGTYRIQLQTEAHEFWWLCTHGTPGSRHCKGGVTRDTWAVAEVTLKETPPEASPIPSPPTVAGLRCLAHSVDISANFHTQAPVRGKK